MRAGKTNLKAGLASANLKVECFKSKGDDDGPPMIMKSYLENQMEKLKVEAKAKEGQTESETDTILILQDGFIPVHAAVLSGSSPFFSSIFQMQGFILSPIREILMPEYSLRIMRKVIHLLYSDQVHLKSEKEAEEVRKTLKSLEMNVGSKLITSKLPKSRPPPIIQEVTVFPKSAKAEPLGPGTPDANKSGVIISSQSELSADEIVAQLTQPKSESPTRARKLALNKSSASESESVAESDSDIDLAQVKERNKKEGGQEMVKLAGGKVVVLKPMTVSVEKLNPDSSSNSKATGTPGKVPMQKPIPVVRSKLERDPNDSDTSTDYEADEGRYKNLDWFLGEAKRCQKCKTDHESAAMASGCLTGHSRLRCYFCFRVVKNTELLFSHFQRAHKKAGRENFVMCPFCDQSIPFKSVSCHVISLHLTATNRVQKNRAGFGPGRPTVALLPPAKRPKLAHDAGSEESDLMVGNLDCTIRHVKSNGKTWVFHLRRSRS